MNPPQAYCCKEDEHTFVRCEDVAIIVPEESSEVHRFATERCVKCGAIRRARDASGRLIEGRE